MIQLVSQQRENNDTTAAASSVLYHYAPPLPLKLFTAPRSHQLTRQRPPLSTGPEADSQSGPYKAVPAPKPLANPPPYRQPPPPANSSSPVLAAARPHLHHNDPSVVASAAATAAASTASSSESNPKSASHGLLAHSSKFPIERELVVTTGDKIAEVGRIERIGLESKTSSENKSPDTESSNMQTIVTQSAWNEERRTVTQGRHGEVIAGAPHHAGHHYPDGFDHVSGSEELHRPASYMPMHIHYTGWRQENNYVPMNFDGRVQQQQQQQQPQQQQHMHQHQPQQPFGLTGNNGSVSLGDHSLSFDSQHTGPASLRDPFAPTSHSNSSHMTQYEIQVDSERADRPSNVTVAPWNNQGSDTSTFDRLRDTCNKMFLRDGPLRGSSQFALSPTLPRAMERLTIDQRNGVEPSTMANPNNESSIAHSHVPSDKTQKEEVDTTAGNNKNGSMRKKLTGKTYHHIKDMFTTKFNKSSKSKLNGTENNAGAGQDNANSSAANTAAAVAAAAAAAEAIVTEHGMGTQQNGTSGHLGRQPDPVHSINQRIKSQLVGQSNSNHTVNNNNAQQVWGSYGRQSARMEASINESDASALAKLTLSPTPNGTESLAPTQSPYSLRHKPSVTFRMDLNNECQYSGGDNSSSSAAASAVAGTTEPASRYQSRSGQGQVVLYDDTMHFPQHQQPTKEGPSKNSYADHDSSLSSIASAGQGMKNRSVFGYSDYDVPQKSVSLSSPMMNEGGSSSGHQSAGSSSDLDKRSGQSVSTTDSGLGVLTDPSGQRSRVSCQQNYQLDTSTEAEMFGGRTGQLNHSSSDWADAADREVNNVMEMRSYQSKNSQQGLQSATPPLPPLSPDASPKPTPKLQQKFNNSKPDLLEPTNGHSPMVQRVKPTTPAKPTANSHRVSAGIESQTKLGHHAKRRGDESKSSLASKSFSSAKLRSSKSTGALHPLTALQEALDLGDITSTTTGLDLDADSDSSSSHSDDDLSTTMDMNDSRTIRRQLEGLESMYSEVLKALHKKSSRSGPSDYKLSKRRMYGSVSSLPSSVCSRPVYRDRRRNEERRRPKESKSSNKRFQRLESHVVTLARSVAHLSSEMRTQHIMIQEMETIRSEIAQLRAHPLRMGSGNPYNTGASFKLPRGYRVDRDTCWQGAVPALTDPSRVKKLTSFFGDEPPLLRIFLKKLGYEVILKITFQNQICLQYLSGVVISLELFDDYCY
ncbi:uncharacterized protein LOC130685375 isoform X2 [Daphnia carinata]|uniref:uncharacterized protein LOC130685375 isoform X2 n=1 Tax=Daphnia carinata TaxID=120202 RepID=UPI002868E237|nr:uncharacterized protein LOC130685375 isoform X2 [Daphnia carinata]